MDVKIAVASNDGLTINEHFGRATSFSIFRLHDNGHELLEVRVNDPACAGGEHNDNALERSAGLISDCRAVVAVQVGPGAIDALIQHRIFALAMEGPIEAALEKLKKSKRFANRT